MLPVPAEAKFIWPGFERASAISSFVVFAGTEGCTHSMNAPSPARATPIKSRAGSKGSFARSAMLVV